MYWVMRTFLLLAIAVVAHAQMLTFDVASIKPNLSGSHSSGAGTDPGGKFSASNLTLRELIAYAYLIRDFQVTRGPGLLDSDRYDIQAKANTPKEMTRQEVAPYLQSLLAERFQLKLHRETKEGSVYQLMIAKGGPKLKLHVGTGGMTGISGSSGAGVASIEGSKVSMDRLADHLAGKADRPVIDKTGLTGEYDLRLEWSTEQNGVSSGPSIFTALQEQLGLKVESAKGPVEIIVVDSAERASEN